MSQIRDIPDYFLERYEDEFNAWAAQIPRGEFHPLRLFTFNEGDVAPWSPDREQGKQLLGAWLLARLSRQGVEIEPYREADREAILQEAGVEVIFADPGQTVIRPPVWAGNGNGNGTGILR